ncbi:regulator of G-protein signaling 12-like isoform X2 [Physella acuta]|uniref:regulator of G-protein signaling 12-like isoform X2 n=1 Tax=Physella acuta TaxID=109671 RepID=UPI0027DDF86E|nr:regulator of G-protein signaling 12-like isoform X2 [Physella acuta]
MYGSSNSQTKRRKKRLLQATKTVTVVRGKLGYGFTISGQNPCMLSSIVAGSPAQAAGLKPGDLLYFVNGQNVSRAFHDDVVRMVGLSTGSLVLQVAENVNSSDSSDDDYPPRSKSRYPNRVRPRKNHGDRVSKYDRASRQADNLPAHQRQYAPQGTESDLSSSLTSQEDHGWTQGWPRVNQRAAPEAGRGFTYTAVQDGPVISTAKKVSSASAVVKKVPPMSGQSAETHPSVLHNKIVDPVPTPQIEKLNVRAEKDGEEVLLPLVEPLKAVVGYIGSIETPSSHTRPHQRLQALRNAVRRLRVEKKVHTLVLIQVSQTAVTLTNALGKQLALYPSDRIAFSGICPDDERFFGLVTLSLPDDDTSSLLEGGGNTSFPNSSCHVFMIEPELSPHSMHLQQAEAFHIKCSRQSLVCEEFPSSATSLILSIASLYRHGPPRKFDSEIVQSQAFADPMRQAERSNSIASSNGNNSTSDSGLGLAREEAPLEQNEQICVVDLPCDRQLNASCFSVDTSVLSTQGHLSPEVDVVNHTQGSATPRRPLSAFDPRRGLNNSSSSEECWHHVNKLNPRAMPDPAYPGAQSVSPLPQSTENLRQSMQRLLQARQQQLQEQNCMLGSDGESHVGDPVLSLSVAEDGHAVLEGSVGQKVQALFAAPVSVPSTASVRSAFQVPRPVSAPPVKHRFHTQPETVDLETLGKLSPRAYPSASPMAVFRSPSAPPAPFFPHRDSDEDEDDDASDKSEDDPYIRQILEQFSRDKISALEGESRRFSEGFALSKKREKHDVTNPGKWTGSRRAQYSMHKQSFSQSHESLAVGEEVVPSNHKLLSACSVSNIACQTEHGQMDKAGRVASWAVHFDQLLRDPIGIGIFTEFLRKEFSEENIIFWKACEQYRQLVDDQERKSEARAIYSKYLSAKASDPVNVDSTARSYSEKFLDNPTSIMFDIAQQQIFQLMRQDSYARFLKSEIYKTKLMEEMEGKPLEVPVNGMQQEKKKKVKNVDNDKRRRSILPWKQNKKSVKSLGKKGKEDVDKGVDPAPASASASVVLKKAPGPGIDLSTMRKEVFHPKDIRDAPESHFKFCRIVMPDGSTTVVCAKPGQTSRSVLSKLCEKRSVSIASVDVFLLGSDQPLDLNEDISTLGSKEIVIERRVLFRLDLPNGKSIGVKAKPNRTIRDVFKPILNKYGLRLDNVGVHLIGSQELLDLDGSVSELDNQRAVVVLGVDLEERQGSLASRAPVGRHKVGHNGSRGGSGGSLEEITNQIFDDLMRGKSQLAHGFDELGVLELDKAKGYKNEEVRSLGLFALLRKESVKDKSSRTKGKVTFALPRNEAKKKGSTREGERLFEMLSSAQRLRLEEQRGVQVSTGELPSFLCQPDARAGHDVSTTLAGNMFDDVAEISKAGFLRSRGKKVEKTSDSTQEVAPHIKKTSDSTQDLASPIKKTSDSTQDLAPHIKKTSDSTQDLAPHINDKWRVNGSHLSLAAHIDSYFEKSPLIIDSEPNRAHRSERLVVQAPVASPENFSPESKKLKSCPQVKNSAVPNRQLSVSPTSLPSHSPTPLPPHSPTPHSSRTNSSNASPVANVSDKNYSVTLKAPSSSNISHPLGASNSPKQLSDSTNGLPVQLVSPRISPGETCVASNIVRASPRLDQPPSYRQLDPPPYKKRTSLSSINTNSSSGKAVFIANSFHQNEKQIIEMSPACSRSAFNSPTWDQLSPPKSTFYSPTQNGGMKSPLHTPSALEFVEKRNQLNHHSSPHPSSLHLPYQLVDPEDETVTFV